MKPAFHIFVFMLIVSVNFLGCTGSLIYSPSANLSPQPLKKEQSQVLIGIAEFPETRPHLSVEKTAYGGELTYRYAICDHFTLQVKGWKDLEDESDDDRWGGSFSIIAMLNDSSDFRFGLMPTGAFLFGNGEAGGGGGALPVCFWFTRYTPFNFYTSLAPAIGVRDMGAEKKQWGWGIIMNVGTAVSIKNRLTLNLEISGIKQINEYEDIEDNFVCPSFNVGYIFN